MANILEWCDFEARTRMNLMISDTYDVGSQTMMERTLGFVLKHPKTILIAVLLVFLLTGFVGEVAAHDPAGVAVPACENGAEVVAHENPNCHG